MIFAASPPNTTISASTIPANSTEASITTTEIPRPRGCETVHPSWEGAYERCMDVSNHVIYFNQIIESNLFGSVPVLEIDYENILSMCAAYDRCPKTNVRQCFLPYLSSEVERICRAGKVLKSNYGVCLRETLKPLPQVNPTAEAKQMCTNITLERENYNMKLLQKCGWPAMSSFMDQINILKEIFNCTQWPEFV
ncbi:hypothetical protein CAEBREN_01401 [Caenorhabditis brenneri]|uniref:DUF19 domain-containing protein n=1 Tax=Caenorhabditis brenneri TaxID=135651 RepID=G0NFA8_CAEBE|nr:hypothetical protein CAEBREN_01401 [Caenorhabditis brenneri]